MSRFECALLQVDLSQLESLERVLEEEGGEALQCLLVQVRAKLATARTMDQHADAREIAALDEWYRR